MFDFLFKKRQLLPLPYKREIHCHLIPGMDDGSQTIDFSLKALKSLHEFGVERVIFTPHHTYPRFMKTTEEVQNVFDELKQTAEQKQLPIKCEGFSYEYRVDDSFEELVNTGKWGEPQCQVRPLSGRYLLIENSWRYPAPNLEAMIEKLQEQGYKLILAHPERYNYYAGMKGQHYHHLQDMNVEFQCNVLSFTGYYGDVEKKMAYWMLKQGYVNYMGTDMHNIKHIELIGKFLRSKDYAAIQEELYDSVNNDLI